MQTRIEVVGAGSAALLAGRLAVAFGAASMLGICTAPGCPTIVFGRGTCVAHDALEAPQFDRCSSSRD